MNAPLAGLRNLGPRSAAMLRQAGIDSIDDLRSLGAVAAFAAVRRSQPASLNLLWALHGALTDTPWQVVARTQRLELLLELDDLERPDAQPEKTAR